ncbi:DNA/RNA non-specific endonuclease [Undibacterium pigrum]|uniref:Endonuclease G n=1 Tax=Undibacterium pigrum TaxID=401470 RepID=A0A318K2F4_9BURK|nr:DNA/RNA non-specific endonuclease [Undibacterium pigrum]PXX47484.1 endonuclease G [Undibacterium pigrum]
MSVILEQIAKAEQKASDFDLDADLRFKRDKTPAQLSTLKQQVERKQFLRESMGDTEKADAFFERILLGNELQDVNYLARGVAAARSVARIAIHGPGGSQIGWGTGFLIGPGVLLTNNHVLPDALSCKNSKAHFDYELDVSGEQIGPHIFKLHPERLFQTSISLDFTVVAVDAKASNADVQLSTYSYLPLIEATGKVSDGEWLTIIQHPNGGLKQLCVRENKLIKRTENELWYSTDTLGGSSGSPVFNNDWYVVALHHSGVPLKVNDKVQTIDGRDFDPARDAEDSIKWLANEGIRVSRIVNELKQAQGDHPLLQAVFHAAIPEARIPEFSMSTTFPVNADVPASASHASLSIFSPQRIEVNKMSQAHLGRSVSVTLHIDQDGQVSLGQQTYAAESASFQEAAKTTNRPATFDVPFDASYADRKGYDEGFLGQGKLRINFPKLSADLESKVSHLLKPVDGNNYLLHYHNFSVVMHAQRRFAIYSAANVRHSQRYLMSRPGDDWRVDPRIPIEHQVSNFYYKNNQFDRGHLTRREDLEFGSTPELALQSAADTCHWSNCVPQHAKFNQGKQLWQGLESYVLESGLRKSNLDVQIFTGPIFEEDDPVYKPFPKIQYPVRFWKVIATVNAEQELFATAYILDQSEVIAQFGIEATAPFGAYKTFQVKIAEVERLTGLQFTSGGGVAPVLPLSACDPLAKKKRSTTRRSVAAQESTGFEVPEGYVVLNELDDIYLDQ